MSTNTAQAARGGFEVRVLAEGYGPGAWHGPDLKAALADVSPGSGVLSTCLRPPQHRRDRAASRLLHAQRPREAVRPGCRTICSRG